jgi:predicted GTPase
MSDLTKLTKAQLIDIIQRQEEEKFDDFKEELGLPYQTSEEWIEYIKKIQTLNAERCNDVNDLSDELKSYVEGLETSLRCFSNRAPN